MNEAFAFFYLVVIPIFYYGNPDRLREMLSISAAIVFWILTMDIGESIYYLPVSVLLFSGWMAMSLAWSKSREALWNVLMILSCVTAFYICQRIDRMLALILLFLPAPGIALTMLYDEITRRRTHQDVRVGGIFGNCNHVGVYLATIMLVGVWLSINVSPWLWPFALIVVAGVFYSGSNNAQLAALGGIFSIFIFYQLWFVVGLVPLGMLLLIRKLAWREKLKNRLDICKKAIQLIKEKPLIGWGINSFCIEHCYRKPFIQTHRVHNDFLEFWVEMGGIGLLLFLGMYWAVDWTFDPLLSAQLIIGLLTALWFFTFREMHTALPVFCVLAVLVPHGNQSFHLGYPIGTLITVGLVAILYVQVWKRAAGLYWYVKASRQPTRELQQEYVMRAVEYDPNSKYLTRAAYCSAKNKEGNRAWDFIAKAVNPFDGGVTLVSLYDQAARGAMILGAVGIADIYNQMSIELEPTYSAGLTLAQQIADIKEKMGGGKKCEANVS